MSERNRFFMELSYHGKSFHGWQIQPNSPTVQEVIQEALYTYFRESTPILGSGRTDTGVHASHQVCHFDAPVEFDPIRLQKALNGLLPPSVSIHGIRAVHPDAHARFDALERAYFYRLIFQKNPFLQDRSWLVFTRPDMNRMNEAAEKLLGDQDFEAFSRVKTEVNHFRCQIKSAYWEQKGEEMVFHITSNRFLRGMVRAIVGTLVEIGLGKRSPESLPEIIQSKNRGKAGSAAPAKGLFLSRVVYPDTIYLDL